MFRLIYASRVNCELSQEKVFSIVKKASKNNAKNGITGFLMFNQDYFLQVLEGERTAVNALFQRVSKNELHKDIEIIEYANVPKRLFPKWGMMLASSRTLNQEIYYRYSESKIFNPFHLNTEVAIDMILELAHDANTDADKKEDDMHHKSAEFTKVS